VTGTGRAPSRKGKSRKLVLTYVACCSLTHSKQAGFTLWHLKLKTYSRILMWNELVY